MLPNPYLLAGALAVGLLTGWTANGWRLKKLWADLPSTN